MAARIPQGQLAFVLCCHANNLCTMGSGFRGFPLRITFRCVLHGCESQETGCRKLSLLDIQFDSIHSAEKWRTVPEPRFSHQSQCVWFVGSGLRLGYDTLTLNSGRKWRPRAIWGGRSCRPTRRETLFLLTRSGNVRESKTWFSFWTWSLQQCQIS